MYEEYLLMNEFSGTFILSIGISSSLYYDCDDEQRSNTLILLLVHFVGIYIFKYMGGTDFNPGVSLLKYLIYKEKCIQYKLLYKNFISQILGSTFGFVISYYFRNGLVFKLSINKNSTIYHSIALEILSSFVLYLVIIIQDDVEMKCKVTSIEVMNVFFNIAGVGAGIALGGNVSGAGMNPAIAFGANLVRFLVTGDLQEIKYLPMYIICPFVSSYLCYIFYLKIYK